MEILFEERPYRCIIISPHPQLATLTRPLPQERKKERKSAGLLIFPIKPDILVFLFQKNLDFLPLLGERSRERSELRVRGNNARIFRPYAIALPPHFHHPKKSNPRFLLLVYIGVMNLDFAHQSGIKAHYLQGVSLGAVMLVQQDKYAQGSAGGRTNGVLVFFVWLNICFNIWLNRCLDVWLGGANTLPVPEPASVGNRYRRRMACRIARCALPPVRNFSTFVQFGPKGISPTQFMERLCALSPLGRVRIYGIRYSGSVLQRRALLVCYDHGWWRAPPGEMGRLRCGVWRVHLWPSWS